MPVDRTVSNDQATPGTRPVARIPHLFRVLIGQRPLAGGARHSLDGLREITIGRAGAIETKREGETLALGLPDARMSTRHARIGRSAEGWTLSDLGSTNGTMVDGEKTSAATVLRDGAVLEVGSTVFVFHTNLMCDPESARDVEADAMPGRDLGLATLVPTHAATVDALRQVAAAGVPVLLLGPSGAGKEVVARAVHALSGRTGAFVPVNCGALPETLLESQLFGHVKGSFSGAVKDEVGLVRASDGGTLFLDEIGDMPKTSQVALLRVLQEREVTPVGATKPQKVDLRVVAATHRPVDELEAAGFRSDLYARLAGYTHRLAPLRERIVDLGVLIADLLKRNVADRAASLTLTAPLAQALVRHRWPLNVRELEQALSVAALLANDGVIDLAHAPESIRTPARESDSGSESGRDSGSGRESDRGRENAPLDAADEKIKAALVASLKEHGGNITYVAKAMGKTRMQIHRWMRRFAVDPTSFRG